MIADEERVDIDPIHPTLAAADLAKSPQSLLDALKQDVEDAQQARTIDIPIPGYERTNLMARYRLLPGKRIFVIGQSALRHDKDRFQRNMNAAVDVFIEACEGLYVQPDGADEPVPLDPDGAGEPVGYDERLADWLGWEGLTSLRQIVYRLFGNNDVAMIRHAELLNRWMMNTATDITDQLLSGES